MRYALLDKANIITGYKVAKKKPKGNVIEVVDECDLQPGRYYWSDKEQAFLPIVDKDNSIRHTAEMALFCTVKALEAEGIIELPQPVKVWIEHFTKSFGLKGMNLDGPA